MELGASQDGGGDGAWVDLREVGVHWAFAGGTILLDQGTQASRRVVAGERLLVERSGTVRRNGDDGGKHLVRHAASDAVLRIVPWHDLTGGLGVAPDPRLLELPLTTSGAGVFHLDVHGLVRGDEGDLAASDLVLINQGLVLDADIEGVQRTGEVASAFIEVNANDGGKLLLVLHEDGSRQFHAEVFAGIDFGLAEHSGHPVSGTPVLGHPAKVAGGVEVSAHGELGLATALGDLDRGRVEAGLADLPAVLVSGELRHQTVLHGVVNGGEVGVELFLAVGPVAETGGRDGQAAGVGATTITFTTKVWHRTIDGGVTSFSVGVGRGGDALVAAGAVGGQQAHRVGVVAGTGGDVDQPAKVEQTVVADSGVVLSDTVDSGGAGSTHRHVAVDCRRHRRIHHPLDAGDLLHFDGLNQSAEWIALGGEEVVIGTGVRSGDRNSTGSDIYGCHGVFSKYKLV